MKRRRSLAGSKVFFGVILSVLCLGATAAGVAAGAKRSVAPAPPTLAQAKATVAKYEQPPTELGVSTEPLKTRPVGKTLVFMRCGVPICQEQSKALHEAGKVMGFRVLDSNVGLSPEQINKGWAEGLRKNPDFIIATGVPSIVFKSQLAQAASRHIPVMVWSSPDLPGNGITVNLFGPKDHTLNGELMAQYIAAKSNGTANTLLLTAPEFAVHAFTLKGFQRAYKSACRGCGLTVLKVAGKDIGRVIPGRVVSAVQQNPKITWIAAVFGDLEIGVPQALQSAGLGGKVNVFSTAGSRVNWQYVKSGQQTADLAYSMSFFGWKAVDTAARVLDGQYHASDIGPMANQFLTKANLTFNINAGWPAVPNFRDSFRKLWGVG
jgi:ribose transport system substrate-binding protein